MSKRLNAFLLIVFWMVAMFSVASSAQAATTQPPGWPWRGVNMASIDSTPADIPILVGRLGVNSVHLRMRPEKLGQVKHLSASEAWPRAITWADAMLEACKQNHVVGIVEVTGVPLGKLQEDTQATPAFWVSSTKKQEYLQRLASLAQHLRNHGAEFAAYDIMSEPVMFVGGKAVRPPGWREFQIEIVKTIRARDPNRWIMVKPGPWGSPAGYKGMKPLAAARLIYSVHMYEPHSFTHQGIKQYRLGPKYPGLIGSKIWNAAALVRELTPVSDFQQKYNVPIYVGEFSAVRWAPGAEAYIQDLARIFNANNWGWAYFTYSGWNGWNPNYNIEYSDSPISSKSDYVGLKSKRWATLRTILPKSTGSN